MSTFRKSLKLKRTKSLVHEVKSREIKPNTTSNNSQNKSTLNRRSISILRQSFRSLSSQLSLQQNSSSNSENTTSNSSNKKIQTLTIKKARQHEIGLFKASSKVDTTKISLQEDINIKICKTSGKTFKTFKKWNNKKNSGRVIIGSCRIIFQKMTNLTDKENNLASITFQDNSPKLSEDTETEKIQKNQKEVEEEHIFEINKISSLYLASGRSKELLITFKGDDQIFFLKGSRPYDVQKIVKFIFIEARRLCFILNKVFETFLPKFDLKLIREGKIKRDEIFQAELCLRELVDLTLFCRGPYEIGFVDIAQLFGSFLVELGEEYKEEAEFWINFSHQAKYQIEQKMRQNEGIGNLVEIDTKTKRRSVGVKKKTVLEEMRNPTEVTEQFSMKGMSTPREDEVEELTTQIKQGIQYSAKALFKKQL